MKFLRPILMPLAFVLLVAVGIGTLLWFNDTAREVVYDAVKNIFMIVSTPFIFETIAASTFLLGLLAYNRWRLHKEGDGWVYLMTRESGAGGTAAPQIHSVILPHKPEPVNEDEDEAVVIDGYLELGMAAQALEELNRAEMGSTPTLEAVLLRIRVLAANLDTSAALGLLRETAARDLQAKPRLAEGAEQTAAWMRTHLPSHADEARLWETEATRMKQE